MAGQTGVTVEFQHPASGQEKEQFNLIVADGSLPDIMEWQWVKQYPGGPEKGNQGWRNYSFERYL